MKTKVILSLLLLVLFASCSTPKSIYRMVPNKKQESYWIQGQEFLVNKKNGVEVALAFNSFVENEIVFELKVTNNSGEPVIADPQKAFLTYNDNSRNMYSAVDPERRIIKLQKNINESEAAIDNTETMSIIGTLIYGAAAVASAANDEDEYDRHETGELIYEGLRFRDEMEYEKYKEQRKISYMNDRTKYWKEYAFRKTTIQDGYYHNGTLHFISGYSSNMIITIPVEGMKFNFYYSVYKQY